MVDGGKRDRLVWPGDIVVSAPSKFVSTGNLDAVKNALDSLFLLQQRDGRLPYAGTPYVSPPERFLFSFTYHLYTLLVLNDYYIYTGDFGYLARYWRPYRLAIDYALSQVDNSGMTNVTSTNDWLRSGMGGHNVEVRRSCSTLSVSGLILSYFIRQTQSYIILWASAQRLPKS